MYINNNLPKAQYFKQNATFGKQFKHEKKYPATNKEKVDKKVLAATIFTSIAMILGTLAGLAKLKRAKGVKDARMFNMHLQEPEILALGTATITGAFIGGSLADKPKNCKAKLRETAHQFIGNILTPLGFMYILNTGLDKLNIKMPNLKGKSKIAKAVNTAINILPSLTTSCVGLWTGINVGNKISEPINNKIFGKSEKQREVRLLDYCIHIDDPVTVVTVADKSGKITKFTSKIMPFTFILSGYQIGLAQSDK